jgi:hypothetical protein
MALSTIDADGGSWSSPVQFQHDRQLRITFLSLPGARHVANIERDPRVSAAIYSFPGPPGGNLGLQLRGTAERDGGPADGWQRFVITIEELWYFDSRADRARHRVDISDLKL